MNLLHNSNYTYKIINTVLIIVFLSHLTFLHDYLGNYVICYGADGHEAIERINECDDCMSSNFQVPEILQGIETVAQSDCEDIALEENCISESQFIPKKKITVSTSIVKVATIKLTPCRNTEINPITNRIFENITIENYTTVSLLI